jgi:hypothetical protein
LSLVLPLTRKDAYLKMVPSLAEKDLASSFDEVGKRIKKQAAV